MDRLDDNFGKSEDLIANNIEQLKQLFPMAFTEDKIDFDVLKQLLGEYMESNDEKYGLNWFGKKKARQIALTPSLGTLRPCPDESVDWDTTENILIEGDNLEVLKLLQRSYNRRVKAIYIDPPYNTGRNVIYPNDYKDGIKTYLEITGQIEGGQKLTTNPEASGRYHSNWLSMIYPRLVISKSLLRSDGILFCTIDENEHATLSIVMKEVFPEGAYEHAYVTIVHNPRGQQGKNISYVHENAIIVYPADQQKYLADVAKEEVDARNLRDSGTESDRTDARTCFYPIIVADNRIIEIGEVPPPDIHPESCNVLRSDGSIEVWPMTDNGDEKKWRYSKESVVKIIDKLEPKKGRQSVQIIYNKDSGTMRSVWQAAKYDSSEYGTKLIEGLIDKAGFTFPKSLWAVYDALRIMTDNDRDAIVLDFFAGSGTTGHALWELNKEMGGNRRFVLVQLQEALDPGDSDQMIAAEFCKKMNRPLNIAEITKERLRRSGKKIQEENPHYKGDLGFKIFRLDSSNIKPWDPSDSDIEGTIDKYTDYVKHDRSEHDILYELLLKLGLDLSVQIESREICHKKVYNIGQGVLLVCLSTSISSNEIEPLAKGIIEWITEQKPETETMIVFRDSAYENDVAKTNTSAIFNQHGFNNIRSL